MCELCGENESDADVIVNENTIYPMCNECYFIFLKNYFKLRKEVK